MENRIYFRQLLSGRDFATDNPIAQQMVNFVYIIGDRETGEAMLVDPAYEVHELLEILEAEGLRLTGVLATHWHPDHVGGDLM
ncbi:MAG: MBL fold metallo-hydrolase, partial [Actinobacteria bacterium]